jgi:hypothetical protein
VSWGDYASHPFTTDLGLEPGGQKAVAGREIFRAD